MIGIPSTVNNLVLLCAWSISMIFLGGLGVWIHDNPSTRSAPPAPTITETGPTTKAIEGLADFISVKVFFADVITGDTDNFKGVWLVKGDVLVGCDLSKARIAATDATTKRATIVLPPPRPISPRIDHEKTRTWRIDQKAWFLWDRSEEGALRDEAMRKAQKTVENAGNTPETLQAARTGTEKMVKKLYELDKWTVDVEWDDKPSQAGKP